MPKKKLTAVVVKNLKPESKMVEYFDTGKKLSKGSFALRVSPKNKKTWFLMYTIHGKLRKIVIGTYPDLSLADARKKATTIISDVINGKDPQAEKSAYRVSETFNDLWADYIKSPRYLKKVAASRREELRKYDKLLKNTIGPMKVQDIRKKHLFPVLDDLARVAPVNANRLFALLSFVLRFALDKDLIEVHPMSGMSKPGGDETARSRHLKPDEIKLLWPAFDTLSPAVRDVFRLILLTAQRPGEVMAMKAEEVNKQEKTWTIPPEKTKTKKEHIVPLSKQAFDIIEPRLEGEYIFPSSRAGHIKNISKPRYQLWKEVDVEHWTAHDLRRTARTLMGKRGVMPDIAERILNHSRSKIEATYDHYSYIDEKRIALDKLGREIDQIIGAEPVKVIKLRARG